MIFVARLEIIDSRPAFRLGLTSILSDAGFEQVHTCGAWNQELFSTADLFLIDPGSLAGRRPISYAFTLRFLNLALSRGPVILLDHSGSPGALDGFRRYGIQGVLSAQSDRDEIITAVVRVSAGKRYWRGCRDDLPDPGQESVLSPREQQVLNRIAKGHTHGQVARALGISVHTVDTYVKRIRSKLELGNKAELTRAALLGCTDDFCFLGLVDDELDDVEYGPPDQTCCEM
ncbi:DNA-binding response regulator [Nocardia terpenica]|uniref:DNA-binding response regulator n=1 Tax=Nocardia terpenica TaxID=455432 RepID=A0A6G9YYY4_9NOCA|nr:DNA-binding response regulator [Nocardia terpenica]